MLRSPWLGLLAIVIAGVVGYALSDPTPAPAVLDEVTVTVQPKRETGAGWDFGGGMPDPEVRVEHAGTVVARCAATDVVKATCKVGARLDGPVRVVVTDIDSSDHDLIGEVELRAGATSAAGSGAVVAVDARMQGGGGGSAWQRFRALWVALALGLVAAAGLAVYRRRHA